MALFGKIFTDDHIGNLYTATADAVVDALDTDEKTLIGSGKGITILPADFFVPGRSIRFSFSGFYTSMGMKTIVECRVKLNGVSMLTANIETPAGTTIDQIFGLVGLLTCRTDGVNGTIQGQGATTNGGFAMGAEEMEPMIRTVGQTIDTTIEQEFETTLEWASVSGDNVVTCTNMILESIGFKGDA